MKINVSVIISLVLLAFVIGVEVIVIWPNNQSFEDVLKYPPVDPKYDYEAVTGYAPPSSQSGIKNPQKKYDLDKQVWEYRKNESISVSYKTKKWKSMQITAAIAAIIFMIHAVV